MRTHWIVAALGLIALQPLAADVESKVKLPESGWLVFSCKQTPGKDDYSLSLERAEGQRDEPFWKQQVTYEGRSSPLEWNRLLAADEKDGEVAVLFERNRGSMRFLRCRPATAEVHEWVVAASSLLRMEGSSGRSFKLEAPDKLIHTGPNGPTDTYFIRDGKLLHENGDPLDTGMISINMPPGPGTQRSVGVSPGGVAATEAGTASTTTSAPAAVTENNRGSSGVWMVLAGSAILAGLLWLSWKRGGNAAH